MSFMRWPWTENLNEIFAVSESLLNFFKSD